MRIILSHGRAFRCGILTEAPFPDVPGWFVPWLVAFMAHPTPSPEEQE